MKIIFLLLLICSNINAVNAQFTYSKRTETESSYSLLRKSIIPITLITSGFLLSNSNFEKSLQIDIRNGLGNDFSLGIDDYIRYAPVVQLYTADLLGVESKNHWFDQTKNLVLSSLLTSGATYLLKGEINKQRPGDSDNFNSFPSGHTSLAFSTATVLFEEFKDTSPLLAYSGYVFAIGTGGLRMANNAHFFSDVLVGAGLGIIITKLVYHYEHLIPWNPFKKMKGVSFTPQYNDNGLGFYFSKSF